MYEPKDIPSWLTFFSLHVYEIWTFCSASVYVFHLLTVNA